jgi:hypothetical protein
LFFFSQYPEKRRSKMKKHILAVLALGVILIFTRTSTSYAAIYATTQITDNVYNDGNPQINNNGQMVWQGNDGTDEEIFFYNGTTTIQLTDNTTNDQLSRINNSGQVVWEMLGSSNYEIFFYDGTTTIQLTDNLYPDRAPQINNNGQVVWRGYDGSDYEIFFYDGTTTIQLTDNTTDDLFPWINDSGQVVWSGSDGSDYEIFFYDGTTTIQLTNNTTDDRHPRINNNGQMVWRGGGISNYEIFFYDGTTTIQLTDNTTEDRFPHINNSGQVVWSGSDGSDLEIFFYDGMLTDNMKPDTRPQINDSGQVVWMGYDGSDYEIFLYDGTTTIRVTDNTYSDRLDTGDMNNNGQINDSGQVVWSMYDGADYEIFRAEPGPVLTADTPTPITQPGDQVCVQVNVADVTDLYGCGFDVVYDSSVITYNRTEEGTFLSQGGVDSTSIQTALLDGIEGQVVVGISRLGDTGGVSGSGDLANVCFDVVGAYCSSSTIAFANTFLGGSTPGSEITAEWNDTMISVTLLAPTNPVTSDPGLHNRIDLSWDAVTGADEYEIHRSNTSGGAFELIGTTTGTSYQDTDRIVATFDYYYMVRAVSGGSCTSEFSTEVSGMAEGMLCDLNNDNRVDGRDLYILASAFGSSDGGAKYNYAADLNRDGLIDGEDLIILVAEFGKTL